MSQQRNTEICKTKKNQLDTGHFKMHTGHSSLVVRLPKTNGPGREYTHNSRPTGQHIILPSGEQNHHAGSVPRLQHVKVKKVTQW